MNGRFYDYIDLREVYKVHLLSIQSFTGKNVYSHKPVIKMIIDLDEFNNIETKDINGFNEKLLKHFPKIALHYCSLGYEGGFGERLAEGTFIGHVIEHLSIELQSLMGYEVHFGKTRVIRDTSVYYLVFEYKNEKTAFECGRAAFKIAQCFATGQVINIDEIINRIRKITIETELGPSTMAILEEAKKRSIPVSRIGNGSMLRLGLGKYSRLIQASLTDFPSCISVDSAGNKFYTKQVLRENNLPVPYGDIVYSLESATDMADEIGFPLVVKPLDSNQGKGVTINVRNNEQLIAAYNEALKYGKEVLVERYVKGKDYRVLVIGNKVCAVAERRPPCVVGDGYRTVKELIEIVNANPLRGIDHEKPLTMIKLDEIARQVLAKQGIDENHIPSEGDTVYLRENGNLSTGGTARDCTNEIHPYNTNMAVKAAKVLGLDIAGIDLVIDDIAVPANKGNGSIIEINAAPGLRMHLSPTEGEPINVAENIIDMMFPEGQPSAIPIVSITGTNGKTTTTRLVRHTLSLMGRKVGMTSTSGVYIGNECVLKGDNTGPVSAKMVLGNKEIDAAVLETARGGIIKRGLGYDTADVGVIVNISDDHLGLDGIETLEDLAFVKSLVIEAIKPDGYAVLNADDKMVGYFLNRAVSKTILFANSIENPLIAEHVRTGEKAVFIEDNSIVIFNGVDKIKVIDIDDIPITYKGLVDCNIENSLAAVASLHGLNIPAEIIRTGLQTFKPDLVLNPGRFNIFDMGNFKVMLDYGHNTAGYNAVIKFAKKMNPDRLIGVIGVPGDRQDRNIKEIGKICSKDFSKIYIKEDLDLRGRKPGEVANIIFNALVENNFSMEDIKVIHSELKALESAILDAQPNDMIIMLYEQFEPAVELVNRLSKELEQNSVGEVIALEGIKT